MKLIQLNSKESRNQAQDLVDMAENGSYLIIIKPIELANRKVFSDLLKAEINKKYGKYDTSKPTAAGIQTIEAANKMKDMASLYPYYMDTDSVAFLDNKPSKKENNPEEYWLISYTCHLYGFPNDWHYENTITDCNPADWLAIELQDTTKQLTTRLINAIKIDKQQYDNFKEALDND